MIIIHYHLSLIVILNYAFGIKKFNTVYKLKDDIYFRINIGI